MAIHRLRSFAVRYVCTDILLCLVFFTFLHTDAFLSDFVQDPPESIGQGGWSKFCQLLKIARLEYREFLAELGFGPFLSIRYVHVWHPLVRC